MNLSTDHLFIIAVTKEDLEKLNPPQKCNQYLGASAEWHSMNQGYAQLGRYTGTGFTPRIVRRPIASLPNTMFEGVAINPQEQYCGRWVSCAERQPIQPCGYTIFKNGLAFIGFWCRDWWEYVATDSRQRVTCKPDYWLELFPQPPLPQSPDEVECIQSLANWLKSDGVIYAGKDADLIKCAWLTAWKECAAQHKKG